MPDYPLPTSSKFSPARDLTDREFWIKHWESHREEILIPVSGSNMYSPLFAETFKNKAIKTVCELGGFPGKLSVYLKAKYGVDATMVDYAINRELLKECLQINGLSEGDINVIEADIFTYHPKHSFDLVFSMGLIEHFKNTREIISLHLRYMKPGSELIITLPNFRGINGWFQRIFDPENYNKHVIECMDPTLLKSIFSELALTNVSSSYFGGCAVWLEREKMKPAVARILKTIICRVGGIVSSRIPLESKLFSTMIVVRGTK
jgi:SAM-dependent methyltransferase